MDFRYVLRFAHDCAPLIKPDFIYDGTDKICSSAKCVLISLQLLSPGTDLELRDLIMDDEEVIKFLEWLVSEVPLLQ